MAKQTPVTASLPSHRNERILSYVIVAVIGLSILGIVALLVIEGIQVKVTESTLALVQALTLLPFIGLPVGFILIFVLLITNLRRRGREAQALVRTGK